MRSVFIFILYISSCVLSVYITSHYYYIASTLQDTHTEYASLMRSDVELALGEPFESTTQKESIQLIVQKIFHGQELINQARLLVHTSFQKLPIIIRGIDYTQPNNPHLWVDALDIDPNYSTLSPYSLRYINTIPRLYKLQLNQETKFYICIETEDIYETPTDDFTIKPSTWRELTQNDLGTTNKQDFLDTIIRDINGSITSMIADHPLVVFVDVENNIIQTLYEDCRNGESVQY